MNLTTTSDLQSLRRDHEQLVAFRREVQTSLVQVDQATRRFLTGPLSNAVLRGVVALLEIQTAESRRLFLACKRIREGRENEPLPKHICHPRAMDEEPRRAIERILGEWRNMVSDLDTLVIMSEKQLKAASEQAAR